ncbi:MAG TPA: hypothetical protein VHM90_00975 [Phycisphaerae bacterium]|nr:hypothetical protein [Phycisphaerae bacterium]
MVIRKSIVIALLALAAGQPLRGQVMADRVPADAVAYAGWAGSDSLGGAYDASHLKAFLETLNIPTLATRHIQDALARVNDPQRAEGAKLAQDLFSALAKSPTGLYIGPVDFSNPARPVPKIALISKTGASAAEPLAERISLALARNRPADAPPSGAIATGDYLLIYMGDAKFPERLGATAPERSLAQEESFKSALSQLGTDAAKSAAFVYIDGQAIVQQLGNAVQMGNNAQARQLFAPVADGMGLNGLKQWAWAGNFDGADWKSSSFLAMRDRRNGLLAFFDNKPLSEESLKLIPQSATSAGAFRFDGMRFLDDVTAAAAKVSDEAPKQIETVLQQAYVWTGIDLKRQLFPAFSDEFVYYGTPAGAGNSLRGFTLVNRLKDAKKADSAASAIENFVNLLILQRDANSKMQFKTQKLPGPWDGTEAHVMALPQATPCWAIRNDVFYFSLSLPGLQSAMEMGGGGKPSILENAQFAALRKRLGQESFSSFSFDDLPASAPETYQIVNQVLTTAMAQNGGGMNFVLPPLDKVTPALAPAMSVSWSDASGYHGKGVSPFPGSGMLSPSSYLWLLAIQQARQGAGGATTKKDIGLP